MWLETLLPAFEIRLPSRKAFSFRERDGCRSEVCPLSTAGS